MAAAHLSQELVVTATSLKDEGNTFFAKGSGKEAVKKYEEALRTLLPTTDIASLSSRSPPTSQEVVCAVVSSLEAPAHALSCPATNLISILLSNGSQALFDGKQFARSAVWGEYAFALIDRLLLDHTVVSTWPTEDIARLTATRSKALFRQVRALNAEGNNFQALILLHQVLLPLMTGPEAMSTLGTVPSSIESGMRLENLHKGFGLVHSEAAGMSTIATQRISAEQVIFEEKQLELPKLKASDPAKEHTTTTELVGYYTGQIHAVVAANDVVAWNGIVRAMAGSWPRTLDTMDRSVVAGAIEAASALTSARASSSKRGPPPAAHPWNHRGFCAFEKGERVMVSDEEIAHLALICRYNCFHSGFFRVCALANHSCDPNAAMKYVASQKKVVMVAVKDIMPGDAITVKYFADLEYMMGVGKRRELLHKSWLFWCDCKRCAHDLGIDVTDKSVLTHESVTCESCAAAGRSGGFVFLPTPGHEGHMDDVKLPSSGTCPVCKEVTTFEGGARAGDLACMSQAVEGIITIVQSGADLETVMRAVSAALAVLRPIVHQDHWSTRIILYCYCLYLHSAVSRAFEIVSKRMMPLKEAAGPLLAKMNIDIAADLTSNPAMTASNNGGDALVCVLDLWRRIEPFYPPSQGWAVHTIVCKLVCFNLMLQKDSSLSSTLLPIDRCLELLTHHAPHCGQLEASAYFNVLGNVRSGGSSETDNAWSSETHAQLKKALLASN